MGFNGEDRPEVLPANQRQEVPEGKIPFSDRQVLIGRAVVIVEMDLTQTAAEHLYPFPYGALPKALACPVSKQNRTRDESSPSNSGRSCRGPRS